MSGYLVWTPHSGSQYYYDSRYVQVMGCKSDSVNLLGVVLTQTQVYRNARGFVEITKKFESAGKYE